MLHCPECGSRSTQSTYPERGELVCWDCLCLRGKRVLVLRVDSSERQSQIRVPLERTEKANRVPRK
jgi:transcription initiation factor TFIIIB Brf1 subunit/transcription initiation factor TFIIB